MLHHLYRALVARLAALLGLAPRRAPALPPAAAGRATLGAEFDGLNDQLGELREALGHLRGALVELEDAKRRRADAQAPGTPRRDLN